MTGLCPSLSHHDLIKHFSIEVDLCNEIFIKFIGQIFMELQPFSFIIDLTHLEAAFCLFMILQFVQSYFCFAVFNFVFAFLLILNSESVSSYLPIRNGLTCNRIKLNTSK